MKVEVLELAKQEFYNQASTSPSRPESIKTVSASPKECTIGSPMTLRLVLRRMETPGSHLDREGGSTYHEAKK